MPITMLLSTATVLGHTHIKDARSVSEYPYNRFQISQYVKYTKYINFAKEIANVCDQ